MKDLKGAVVGGGFWADCQIAAWQEVPGVHLVAICNRTESKAEKLAKKYAIPHVYADVAEMLRVEKPNFLDVITSPDTHAEYVAVAAELGVPVICQKPLAPTLQQARQMVLQCQQAKVSLYVHENWRWQNQIRAVKRVLAAGTIGKLHRAKILYNSSFPVFENQPFLKELEQFILTDMGTHILDVARFLLGEAESVYCQTQSVTPGIKGEDMASVDLRMRSGMSCHVELSYASKLENELFPEVFMQIEGANGSIELAPDLWVRVTTSDGTTAERFEPPHFAWADPKYALVQTSMVALHQHFYAVLTGKTAVAESTGQDNLKTLELVFAAYESSKLNQVVLV